MNYQLLARKLCLVLTWIGTALTIGHGQNVSIGVEEALLIARERFAGLERDRLSIFQQEELAKSGMLTQPSQLFYTTEEFSFKGQSGVQSFNVQQNFFLPKAVRAQKDYYKQGVLLAERRLALTEQELKRQVEQAYYRLQYAKQEHALSIENLDLYNDFLAVTTGQLERGEASKIPQIAARSSLGKAQLNREHAREKYQIALTLFNHWLQSDTLYDVEGELQLTLPSSVDTGLEDNPHLHIIQAQQELAIARLEIQKVQKLPQINSGFRLQSAFGTFPLFGYQLGFNMPLFQKSYKGRIEAAEVGVKVQEAALKTEQQKLIRTISELRYRIEHQRRILEYIQVDLRPLVNEQSEVNLQAYREGEIGYLEYLNSLEQVMEVKQQYLNALYQFNALQVELTYWHGT